MKEDHIYMAIDLKSFYASVECRERGLNPLTTHLVVADMSRTEKTICLAVSPALKAYGIPGRARLFEVAQKVREANRERLSRAAGGSFSGSSSNAEELERDSSLELSYIVAPPRMAHYIRCSTEIYQVYLKYIAPEDIHVYSIDEVLMDVTRYLELYHMSPRQLAVKIIRDVFETTGITAAAGIGTNLYLCKIAMDIGAKHTAPDENGVRIAQLNELTYRQMLWDHRPLTDFWRIGRGYAKKLQELGLETMGDIARCSLGKETDYYNEELLYRVFGINAELLIDHAWGWEPCTMADIKAYRPETNSIVSGQVLQCPYSWEKARLVIKEMADSLALGLVEKGLAAKQVVLTIGYDIENLKDRGIQDQYAGEVVTDRYGRKIPKHSHGTANLEKATASSEKMMEEALKLYDRIANRKLLIRRLSITAGQVAPEASFREEEAWEQLSLFTDYKAKEREQERSEREKRLQKAVVDIKKKYGKNAVLRGMSLEDGATAIERNRQIGGHKA